MLGAWLPDGLGEFARWMRWLLLLYVVLLCGVIYITMGKPWAAALTMPVTGGYFARWVPANRRIMKRIRALEGRVCYHCGFEMAADVGATCTECGHEQTENNRKAIEQFRTSFRTSDRGV